jgi:hypothetical protein
MDPNWRPLDASPSDSRLITREQLAQAFGQAYCSEKNKHKELDAEVGIELANILFGKETP